MSSLTLITGALVGLAAGYLGSFMVLRRMSLVGDALSHVALPGLALGLIFSFNPFLGAFATLFLAIVLIWLVENKTKLPAETLVGVAFTLSLAIGLLITPQPELLEALFGDISTLGKTEALWGILIALGTIWLVASIARSLVLGTLSEDLARSTGIPTKKVDFLFLLAVALIVAVGIKIVGTLLMGALVIIPAATAKNLAHSLNSYNWMAGILGLVSVLGGIYLATYYHQSPGPLVVLASTALFLLSLAVKKPTTWFFYKKS